MRTAELRKLWALAFGDSEEVMDCFFSTAYSPDRCRFLQEGEEIIAALYWLDGECCGKKYAYIYGVATHPDHRGKGLCRKLMARTHADLQALGYAGALLMPAEPGLRRMYASFGYTEGSCIAEQEITAGETGVSLRAVTVAEYAALRRAGLPRDGLVQEGESLAYLAAYSSFYAGAGFVMAAVHEEGRIFVPELLGDIRLAPGILKSMGYERGTFRTPGGKKPFAMFLPLQENAPMPTYLGHAFD